MAAAILQIARDAIGRVTYEPGGQARHSGKVGLPVRRGVGGRVTGNSISTQEDAQVDIQIECIKVGLDSYGPLHHSGTSQTLEKVGEDRTPMMRSHPGVPHRLAPHVSIKVRTLSAGSTPGANSKERRMVLADPGQKIEHDGHHQVDRQGRTEQGSTPGPRTMLHRPVAGYSRAGRTGA